MIPTRSNDQKAVTVGHSGTHLWDLTLSDLSSKGFLLVRRGCRLELAIMSHILSRQDYSQTGSLISFGRLPS